MSHFKRHVFFCTNQRANGEACCQNHGASEVRDYATERVKALGGQVLNGPMDVPGGDRIAQCLDPQGAAFPVHARAD